ncbi:methyl-coenzyme M reductase operon protein D [Methanolobus bombayensis]|uniref:methyl-coenzyme M reductase operon protein D n=1 Tax=Methanolobus bombayensis TaxID=38023 RepID=UPI001AE31431|nr:methyl-coenzyme M reductase operon protein D [Methanolobus bombayensis]MBP1909451.1 methyl-coenzyme M reductase subunit D [Methanolobus bombayensis]
MSDTLSETNFVQLEIFPSRLLKPETAQNLLTSIAEIDGIVRLFVHGPRLPQTVPYGPASGLPVNHPGNAVIEVAGQAIELAVYVGSIRMEVVDVDTKEQVREVCEDVLSIPFEFREGNFIPTKQTVTDYAKRGPGADPMMIGMTDPKGKLKDQPVCILKPEDKDE